MIKEIKHYHCDDQPKDEDIRQGMEIAKANKCRVDIHWFVKYSGKYRIIVNEDSSFEDVKKQIPKYYGM